MLYRQAGWRWCRKCQGYFYDQPGAGVCPAGGGHDPSASGPYATVDASMTRVPPGDVVAETTGFEGGWAYCRNCAGLFASHVPTCPCPAGSIHDPSASASYFVYFDSPLLDRQTAGYQLGWRQCTICAGMVFAGNGSAGACPGAAGGHVVDETHDYAMLGSGQLDALQGSTLLVIAPPAHAAAIQPLVDHRNATGVSASLLSFDADLLSRLPGRDDAERLKRAITYAVEYAGTRYVLLAGDASTLPVRYRYIQWGRAPGDTQTYWRIGSYAPTDHYYANLYRGRTPSDTETTYVWGDWDQDRNGRYNELFSAPSENPDGVDGYPDIAVGRVPTRDPVELARYVQKLLAFERGDLRHWSNAATLVVDGNYDGATADMDIIAAGLNASDWPGLDRVGFNFGSGNPAPAGTRTPGADDTVAAITARSAWVVYLGHGDWQGWDVAGTDAGSIAALPAAANVPVVIGVGCQTAQLTSFAPDGPEPYVDTSGEVRDYWTLPPGQPVELIADFGSNDPRGGSGTPLREWRLTVDGAITPEEPSVYQPDCLTVARQWLVSSADAGAVAYLGEQTVAPDYPGAQLAGHLLSHVGASAGLGEALGDLWLQGCRDYWQQFADDPDWINNARVYLCYMTLYGDPSLQL